MKTKPPNQKPFGTNFAFFACSLTACHYVCDPELEPHLAFVEETAAKLAKNPFDPDAEWVYRDEGYPRPMDSRWLAKEEIEALLLLPDSFAGAQAEKIARAVDLFLKAQLGHLYETAVQEVQKL